MPSLLPIIKNMCSIRGDEIHVAMYVFWYCQDVLSSQDNAIHTYNCKPRSPTRFSTSCLCPILDNLYFNERERSKRVNILLTWHRYHNLQESLNWYPLKTSNQNTCTKFVNPRKWNRTAKEKSIQSSGNSYKTGSVIFI